jgi:hypothetical protein
MATQIVPADQRTYVPVGGNELMLLAEFSRTVTVDCARCGHADGFKLIADDMLTGDHCDELLNTHLQQLGWRVGDDDTCPACLLVEHEEQSGHYLT